MKFVKGKIINLVLLSLALTSFLLFAFLGISDVGYSRFIEKTYLNLNLYDIDGKIFVPIAGGLFAIILFFTVLFCFDKLKFIRLHKFMSAFDFLSIFGVVLAQTIVLDDRILFYDSGIAVMAFGVLTCVFSMMSMALCLFQLFLMPKYISPNKERKIRIQNSNFATQKLIELKELLDLEAITEEEYNEKKSKYINML